MNQRQLGNIILLAVGSNEPMSWGAITEEVTRAGWKPTAGQDWLFVRGAVQALINEGMIERVKSVHVEEYQLKEAV